jgi:hypothetical protein
MSCYHSVFHNEAKNRPQKGGRWGKTLFFFSQCQAVKKGDAASGAPLKTDHPSRAVWAKAAGMASLLRLVFPPFFL